MFSGFDTYTLRARLFPVLLHWLPVGLAIVAWFPDKFVGWGLLVGVTTSCGLTVLLAELGRDQGKKKEPGLFDSWGGKPSTQLLRHRNRHLDSNTKARYHKKLSTLIPDIRIPTPKEEAADPEDADQVYDSCTRYLREKTRDRKQFPLVFKEVVSYGFRRNLWGLKTSGVLLAVSGFLVSLLAIGVSIPTIPPAAVAASVLNALLLVWWIFRINPDWIRLVAFAYAERLLAACETL